jgi:phosphate transport system substrate-binding protein
MKKFLLAASILALMPQTGFAREQIRAVGSSTVYPFVTVAAEEFGNKSDFRTPIVEATGTGGGFKLFCSGVGADFPDVVNASRKIKQSEIDLCKSNNVNDIVEIKIGFDGIILAGSNEAQTYNLKKEQIFLALAKKVPVGGKLVDNPYKKWSDIDPSLPGKKIEVYGPPPTSGTRDAFVELVMEKVCPEIAEFKSAFPKEEDRKKQCSIIREDGPYIESGENDNLIVQKLKGNPDAIGIFGYSFLDQNEAYVHGSLVGGVAPTYDNIASGAYPVSRSLYVYVKKQHGGIVPGLKEFSQELISEAAIGTDGYLTLKGLILLPTEERQKVRKSVAESLN